MATHSILLAWKIPWTEESGGLTVHGVAGVGHDLATKPPLNIYPLNELLDERAWGERARSFGERHGVVGLIWRGAWFGGLEARLWVRGGAWQIACFRIGQVGGGAFSGRSHSPDLTVSGRDLAGVTSGQENGKVWSVASTVRFRVDRKDDGGIVICEAQNQALPSGHSKQTQYVLDVQCKCLAGKRPAGKEGSNAPATCPRKNS